MPSDTPQLSTVNSQPSASCSRADHRSTLAICSDLDETPDAETYFELMRFLNTTEETSMGQGVGLEVGNSIYFDMAPGQFSYWNASEEDREKIRTLIRSGHIDCLHSFGDLATTRAHAARALEELERHDCRLKVWVDHAQAATNFGSDIMRGHGDDSDHPAYHADLTVAYGIKYVWRGRVTSVIGQDVKANLAGIGRWRHPFASARTLGKEAAKQVFGRLGNRKYAFHSKNKLVAEGTLRDGNVVQEFLRCSPHWSGISGRDRGDAIHEVLSRSFLDRLLRRRGHSILYTHLGKLEGGRYPRRLSPAAVNAFRLLADYVKRGEILVTTTARLLELSRSARENRNGSDPSVPGVYTPSENSNSPAQPWSPLKFPALE